MLMDGLLLKVIKNIMIIRRMVLQKLDMKLFLEKPVYLKKIPIYHNLEIPSGNNNKKYEEE